MYTEKDLQGPFGRPPAPRTGCTASTEFTDNSFGPGKVQITICQCDSAGSSQAKTNRCEQYPHSARVSSCNRHVVCQSKKCTTLSTWIVCS